MKCKQCGFEFSEGIFCPECGTKNDLNEVNEDIVLKNHEGEEGIGNIDKTIEEVVFYYEQSRQKREAEENSDQFYYNRAQQLLAQRIKQKIPDYRVWWEACKPIDFWEEKFSEEMIEKYKVNDTYFTKALDFADLEIKKKLVSERDTYQQRKKNAMDEMNKVKAEKRAEEEKIIAERAAEAKKQEEERKKVEKIQREKETEEQRIREQSELARHEEAERIKREERERKKLENEGKVMAIVSLFCGIVSLCSLGCFIIPQIMGIFFAFQGKKQGVMRGQAKAGLICSFISIIILIGFIVLSMSL